jgi:F-type H+-transporting ATPase subunit delta
MSDQTTIARPYARAVFDQARAENSLESWSEMLTLAAIIAKDPMMSSMLDNPLIARDRITEMFLDVAGERFSEGGRNLVRTLAVHDRLAILPEIARLFEERKAGAENWLEAQVISAYPINADQEQILIQALARRFGRTINITVQVDRTLIGGAIIHVGDIVIDGSLRAGLTQMADELRI